MATSPSMASEASWYSTTQRWPCRATAAKRPAVGDRLGLVGRPDRPVHELVGGRQHAHETEQGDADDDTDLARRR